MAAPVTRGARRQAGFSYVEVLLATTILALALVPALDALRVGVQGSGVHRDRAIQHYRLVGVMETVLAEPFGKLQSEAAAAAGAPTAYSDPGGTPDRRLVYLAGWDGDDADGDGDPTTGVDPGLLYVRVEIAGTGLRLESLTAQ